ncbi:MAG: hypothetical protein ACREHG_00690, partial [Candidatus Saccharimonadales bacterium]
NRRPLSTPWLITRRSCNYLLALTIRANIYGVESLSAAGANRDFCRSRQKGLSRYGERHIADLHTGRILSGVVAADINTSK